MPASAQTQQEVRQQCIDADPEISIRGCTAMIEGGRESGNNLAIAYFNRGNGFNRKGDYDRAIQDYSQAIVLNPTYDRAYGNRGNAWFRKGDYDKAIADYNACLRLNPNVTSIVENRRLALERKAGWKKLPRGASPQERLQLHESTASLCTNAAAYKPRSARGGTVHGRGAPI